MTLAFVMAVGDNHTAVVPPTKPHVKQAQPPAPAQRFLVTAYTARCDGCTGITAAGYDVRRTIFHDGLRVVAVDPAVIPLGSTVRLQLPEGRAITAVAGDVGGMIRGRHIDLLVTHKSEARTWGRRWLDAEILRKGGN